MEVSPTILTVDDEYPIRESFKLILDGKYNLYQAASGEAGLKIIAENNVDLVLLDIRMPGMSGIETLGKIKEISPKTDVVMVTAVNDVFRASEATRLGAYNYLIKPFDVDTVLNLCEEVFAKRGSVLQPSGDSDKTKQIDFSWAQSIKKNILSNNWILLSGPAGVEKDFVARLTNKLLGLHKRFVKADLVCSTPEGVDYKIFHNGESEQDSFVFIDNADLLTEELQEKISKSSFYFVFGTTKTSKEIKLLPAILDKIGNSVTVIQPLASRTGDIQKFIDIFFDEAKTKYVSNIKEISKEAKDILSAYIWPGNTVELKNLVFRLVATLKKDKIEPLDIPIDILISSPFTQSIQLEEAYSSFEIKFLRKVASRCKWDTDIAAKVLGIQPAVLDSKIQ